MIKKIWKYIVITFSFIVTFLIAFLSFLLFGFIRNKKIEKALNENEKIIDEIKEDKKKDEETYNNINNDFNNSPFNRSRT